MTKINIGPKQYEPAETHRLAYEAKNFFLEDQLQACKLQKITNKKSKQAYLDGYKSALSSRSCKSKNQDVVSTEKLSLNWLDGWLDGVEALEKQNRHQTY